VSALTLVHLTCVGPDKQPATVDFGPRLTVIYGASESGKSYIVEAIDYMLGATKLKEIREADGYTRILLGLRLADGEIVTLSRAPGESKVGVYSGDFRTLPTVAPNTMLSVRHHPKSEDNLSRYLLKILGVDGRHVLKNTRRDLRTLSFRDLAHLCVITDTRMAEPRSPVLASGMRTKETEDKSVFKFVLSGEDEPEGPRGTSDVEKKVGKGKIELLDQLITDAQSSLTIPASESELHDQLRRLEETLGSTSAVAGELVTQRSALVERARALQSQTIENRDRAGEVQALLGRFGLLRQQYESDIARLQMVAEAGNLLGYFRTGPCVFCGADPEHQQPGHNLAETTELQAAVAAETRKTTELHVDLLTTMEDLEEQLILLNTENASRGTANGLLSRELASLDARLTPLHEDTKALLATRSQIQADLALHSQIQRLENLKATLSSTAPTPPPARADGIPVADLADFERTVHQILASWQVPGDNRVTYDQKTAEISVDHRPRSSRGRGMRSIIHAAFSMALAQYTAGRELPHPGFVILDSPVLTYREPDEDDTELTYNVVEHFYRALLDDSSAQVIVVENGDPPQDLATLAKVYAFHTSGAERAGFFPV
jgi:hypothetical protein